MPASRADRSTCPVPEHLGEVADPAQQAVRDARGAAGAPCDLVRRVLVDRNAEQLRAARDDARQVLGRIEVEADDVAEARASGAVSSPVRVVAPTRVNAGTGMRRALAYAPSPVWTSITSSSIAG
jgi:hypothetical protein